MVEENHIKTIVLKQYKYFLPAGSWPLKEEAYRVFFRNGGYEIGNEDEADFLVLPGGVDIGVNLERDLYERKVYHYFNDKRKPIIAICRGMQLILTENGEDLIQHIPDITTEVLHTTVFSDWRGQSSWHKTELGLFTNSRHHQGFLKVSNKWEVIDKTKDGIIEAVGKDKQFGVQWHPEAPEMIGSDAEKWFLWKVDQTLK